jgi:hypothetical protein
MAALAAETASLHVRNGRAKPNKKGPHPFGIQTTAIDDWKYEDKKLILLHQDY